jgi:hypothetical protein
LTAPKIGLVMMRVFRPELSQDPFLGKKWPQNCTTGVIQPEKSRYIGTFEVIAGILKFLHQNHLIII